MPFEHACFISYRRVPSDEAKRFKDDLHKALAGEIAAYLGKVEYVFIDDDLSAGDRLEKTLAWKLCHSVCMVLIYTPAYFDRSDPDCAREYKAMRALETQRLGSLPAEERQHVLIIPVIYRGEKYLPDEVKAPLFAKLDSLTGGLDSHPDYVTAVKKIADYIIERCQAFVNHKVDAKDCDQFALPSPDEIRPWLESVTKNSPCLLFCKKEA